MKLFVLRHGETQWNRERRLAGRSDIPLNENGIKLSKITAKALEDVEFDLCFSSPLMRAVQTAKIVLNGRLIPFKREPALMEIDFGDYEGVRCVDQDDNIIVPEYGPFQMDPMNFKGMPGGESIQDVLKRAGEYFDRLISVPVYQDKTILLSTHGCYYRAFLNRLYPEPEYFWHTGVPQNCALSVVEVENGVPRLVEDDLIFYDPALALPYFKNWKIRKKETDPQDSVQDENAEQWAE